MDSIPTYIINLKHRTDRKRHATNQFAKNSSLFRYHVFEAIEHAVPDRGIWLSIRSIITEADRMDYDFVLVCEDDHVFTTHFNGDLLNSCIKESARLDADILSGGVSWFDTAVQVSKDMFWVDHFNGLQFTIFFKKFYQTILSAEVVSKWTSDTRLGEMSSNTLVIHPFISVQKEFGYSDVTKKNSEDGYVSKLFENRSEKLTQLAAVSHFYGLNYKSL